jgi:hypothetical protein
MGSIPRTARTGLNMTRARSGPEAGLPVLGGNDKDFERWRETEQREGGKE